MSSNDTPFSDFYNWLTIDKKHNWSQKVTTVHMNKVFNANQIQYKLLPRTDGRVDLQAINIMDNDADSLDPETVSSEHLDLLKIFLSKKWLLAETLPLAQKTLTADRHALFCAYILYYDLIIDHFLAKQDDILKVWFVLEFFSGGRHHRYAPKKRVAGNATSDAAGSPSGSGHAQTFSDDDIVLDENFDIKMASQQAMSSWRIHTLCRKSGNVRRVSNKKLSVMKDHLLKWFMDDADVPGDGAATRRKRTRSLAGDGSTVDKSKDNTNANSDEDSDDNGSRSERGRKRTRRSKEIETSLKPTPRERSRSASESSLSSIMSLSHLDFLLGDSATPGPQ